MKTKTLLLVLAVILGGCARRPYLPPVPTENDTSIVMPQFLEEPFVEVGRAGSQYELDGALMRALLIAINDYRPFSAGALPCLHSPWAQRYRVIRKGDIIFVDIVPDPEFCGLQVIMLHAGVTYAISTDGRILRRVTGSSPENELPLVPSESDAPAIPPQDVDAADPKPAQDEPASGAAPAQPEPSPVPQPSPPNGP
ncbi:hypothetical protein P2318_04785 [Myxococcaceae bacterium GXIMD 01537]